MDASFFILISFCVFSFIFMKKLWPGIAWGLDQHIADIKNEVFKKKFAISEHEKLKALYQERLQHLHEEIEELKASASQKFDFLKIKLDAELEMQYAYRQRSFQQVIYRMQRQQRKTLQTRCVEEILERVKEELKKNSSFNDEYMVSLLGTHKEDSGLKL
jgi:F0F1-type ATP synthase membrane subunit b/b'